MPSTRPRWPRRQPTPGEPPRQEPPALPSFHWTKFARTRTGFSLDLVLIWRIASWLIVGLVPILSIWLLMRALGQPTQQVIVQHEPRPAPDVRHRMPRPPPENRPLAQRPKNRPNSPEQPKGRADAQPPAEVERGAVPVALPGLPGANPIGLPFKVSRERLDLLPGSVNEIVGLARSLVTREVAFAPYLQIFENGKLDACQEYDVKFGRLNGRGLWLYRNGQAMLFATFKDNSLHGQLRLWDEQGVLVLYGEYTNGNRSGLMCLFNKALPWLVIDGDDEFLVVRDTQAVFDLAIDLPAEGKPEEKSARARLAELDSMIAELLAGHRRNVREWFEDERAGFQRPLRAQRAMEIRQKRALARRERDERRRAIQQAGVDALLGR